MSNYQIYMFLRLTMLLTIIVAVKSRSIISTTEAQTEFGSVNDILDGRNGLNSTGELDKKINNLLLPASCGVRDKNLSINNRAKRYAVAGRVWNKKNLTYNILSYPPNKNETWIDNVIRRAFAVWSQHTSLIFIHKKTGEVDIKIEFLADEHFRGYSKNHLANAIVARENADIHFNVKYKWTIDSIDGINLFETAVHEIGHNLGLEHSDEKESVMTPDYTAYNPNFKLNDDDIRAIELLYGNKSSPNKNGPFSDLAVSHSKERVIDLLPRVAQNNDLCKDPKIDTILNTDSYQAYVFKGEKYYKLNVFSVADGYPKLISNGWPGLPGGIDAAFTDKNGQTCFFKGSKFWRYNGSQIVDGYPKDISEEFNGIPDNLDTAMRWDGKIYFFKGSTIWIFDPTGTPSVTSSPFRSYLQMKDLPENFDAVYVDVYGTINFFKNDKSYPIRTANQSSVIYSFKIYTEPLILYFGCINVVEFLDKN